MSSLLNEPRAGRIWFDNDSLWLELTDGRRLSVPLYAGN